MTTLINRIADITTIGPDCRERILAPEPPCDRLMASLGLLGVGLSDLARGYQVGSRARRYHVVLQTLAGRGLLILPGGRVDVKPGSLVFLPFASAHYYATAGKWTVLWSHWHPDHERLLLKREAIIAESAEAPRLVPLFESIMDELNRNRAAMSTVLELSIRLMAETILRETESAQKAEGTPGRMTPLIDAMEAELARRWTLAELARVVHVSPTTLSRLCHRTFSASPVELLQRLRLRRAAALLLSGDEPVYLVAARVGYENPYSFSRAFSRWAGESPDQYRRRHMNRSA